MALTRVASRLWLRLVGGAAILGTLVVSIRPQTLLGAFSGIDAAWIALLVPAIVASTLAGTTALYLLITRDRPMEFRRFLRVYWLAWGIGLIVPGQVGDLATVTVALRRRGYDIHVVLGRSTLDKAISLAILATLAAWGMVLVARHHQIYCDNIWVSLAASVAFSGVILTMVARCSHRTVRVATRYALDTWNELLCTLREDLDRVLLNVGLTVFKVACLALAYWGAFRAMGELELSFWQVMPLMAVSSLIAYVPISFNGLGTVEFAGVLLFAVAGADEATVLSAYLLLRVSVFAIAWIPAACWLLATRGHKQEALSQR